MTNDEVLYLKDKKSIVMVVSQKDLELIDEAAKQEMRSRSNFLLISAKEKANEILKND